MVNTDTQRIITGRVGTVISVISDRAYTVSVMSVVDDSRRSEPDRESVIAGGCWKDWWKHTVCSEIQSLTFSGEGCEL